MRKYQLERRTVLRGLLAGSGVTFSLPLLEAMLDDNGEAHADGSSLPCRFMTFFWGNGVYLPTFEPSATGPNFPLSECLAPFDGVIRPYLNVCTGLRNRCRNIITHHEGMCVFNGYDIQPFSGNKPFNSHMGGPTIDQVVANAIAGDTLVRGIHVGVDRKISSADGGTTLAALSHQGTNVPEYPEWNPQKVWTQLFGNAEASDSDLRVGILDAVKDDLNRLQKRLGQVDKEILDRHLEGVLDLEKKILAEPPACIPPGEPSETNPDIPNQQLDVVCDVMDELIALAFKCDITRTATNLFHYGASHFHYHMLGQTNFEHHFDNSHAGASGWQQRYTDVVTFVMARLAHLAQTLYDTQDPNGDRLLDSTIVYASSDCGPGWTHSLRRQPIVLLGHARNKLAFPGVHYEATPNTDPTSGQPPSAGNTSDALLTVLQAYVPTATQVGDLTGANPP
ncbi:MAG: DUF1552 domain-containing protein, partial [Myxococcales bacterium]|nr:DUF1552 domain-containing protein [Myxococcales bacterium]